MENLLQANEISCRVQQISEKGLSLLLYVTSRDGQKRLDEKFGELGWQDRYEVIDGDLHHFRMGFRKKDVDIKRRCRNSLLYGKRKRKSFGCI